MTASDAPEGDETDPSPVLPTHRRSTFEPPTGVPAPKQDALGVDDDALAAALAEELGRVTRTGAIPVPPPTEPGLDTAPERPANVEFVGSATPEPPVWSLDEVPAADSAAPAAPPAATPFTPPVRQSLPDDALAQWIGDGATLESIELLEREMSLRKQDAASFVEWEQSMLALGTPEALGAVDHARTGFADVLQTSTGTIPTVTPHAPTSEPTSSSEPEPEPLRAETDQAGALNAEQLADLALAPAPQSAPFADIPPPPGEPEAAEWSAEHPEVAAGIPELIEPHDVGAVSTPLLDGEKFESFLAAAAGGEEEQQTDAAEPDHAEAFPLAVYDPNEHVPETIDMESPRAFRVELAGLEPSPIEQRIGRSARLFWMWFAANSSVVSVGLGAVIFSLGVSLRQAVIATVVGVSISSLPLGIGALAGKRSGQPTMVVSRATFGLLGNILPALLSLLTRIFWGAALLWLLVLGVAAVNDSTQALALDSATLGYASLGVAFLLIAVIAYLGYGLIARVQATLTIVSSVLVVAFIMLSWPAVNLRAAMRVGDGDWMLVATGAVLVFSVLGLVWAMSSADVARYQNPHSSSAGSMLWSWAGAAIPAFVLIAYGSLLAASDPELLGGLLDEPIETLTLLAPAAVVYGMLAALGVGLLSGTIMTIYSGGFALQALGLRAPRSAVATVVAVLTVVAAAGILAAVADFNELVRDLATTIAVPVAAWVGVFSAELMMRSRRYHAVSLLKRGGVYADFRWVNLVTLVVATAVGYAFTNAAVSWLTWQGYGWSLIGIEPDTVLAATDLGVIGALVLALLVTVVAGKPGINRQERAEAVQPVTESRELD